LASGTTIENLEESEDDNVINIDRGDMLAVKLILDHYKLFQNEMNECSLKDAAADKMAKQRLGLKSGDEIDEALLFEQIKKEKVNAWFYKDLNGNIDKLESIIKNKSYLKKSLFGERKISLQTVLASKKSEVLESGKGFMFMEISGNMPFSDERFDEIHMVSGYGIPICKDPILTKELARILKPGGSIVVTGNIPVLKSIGITITNTYDGQIANCPDFFWEYFDAEDWNWELKAEDVRSEHTLGGI